MPDFLPPSRPSANTAAGHGGLVIAGVTLGLALAAGGIALAGSDRPTSTSATDVPEIAWSEGQVAGTPSLDTAADVSELPDPSSGDDVVVANAAGAAPAQAVSGTQVPGWPISSATGRSAPDPLTLSVAWAGAPTATPGVAAQPAVIGVEAEKPRKPAVTAPPVRPARAPEVVLASGEGTAPTVPVAPIPVAPVPVAPVPVAPVPEAPVPVAPAPVVEAPVVEDVPVVEEPSVVDEPETDPEAPGACGAPVAEPEVSVEVGEVSVEPLDGCEAAPEEEASNEETPGEETPGEETPGEETPSEETPGEDGSVTPIDDAVAPEAAVEAVAEQEVAVTQA